MEILFTYEWSDDQIKKIRLLGLCLDDAIFFLQCTYCGQRCEFNFKADQIRVTSFASTYPAYLKTMWIISYTPGDDANVQMIHEIKAQMRIQSEILAIYYKHR